MPRAGEIGLSILDFGHPGTAVDLVADADGLGYTRYWIGEHHSKWQCPNPLLLGALLAGISSGIRLGSGGVCLRYHSPYRVAEDARLVEYMLPGRFDLGVTRGLSLDQPRLNALLDGRPADSDHLGRLGELHGLVTGRLPQGHPLFQRTLPFESGPPMWVLGGSLESARWAAEKGTGFCISLHHLTDRSVAPSILDEYRRSFVASPEFEEPAAIAAVSVLCSSSEKIARTLHDRLAQLATRESFVPPQITGSAKKCARKLEDLAASCAVDEIMILDFFPTQMAKYRLQMYETLARQMCLPPRAQP